MSLNPIMLQAIKNLTRQRGSDVTFIVAPPDDDDPARLKFFAVNVEIWTHWEAEQYYDLCETGCNFGAQHLAEFAAEGFVILLYCNPAHCAHEEFQDEFFVATLEGSPHWVDWKVYKPGTLLEIVKREHPERIKMADPAAPLYWSFADPTARAREIERQIAFIEMCNWHGSPAGT